MHNVFQYKIRIQLFNDKLESPITLYLNIITKYENTFYLLKEINIFS